VARAAVPSRLELPPFQELLDAHGHDVHRFVRAIVGHDDADDTYQETWIAALRAYPRLRDASNLRGWVFTVAHRKALDRLRARRRAPVPVAELPEHGGGDGFTRPPDEVLWELVRALPDKQRAALALRFVADAAYAEVADVMGTTEDAARRNVHEGLKRLRRQYER
jgi:DNA-directed RNA polymerase specialized sigma24 family protein